MPLIEITPTGIREQANNIRKYKREQEGTMSKIERIVYSLNESWKGEAQDEFLRNFESKKSVYKRLSAVLEEYAALLDKAANEFSTSDQNAKRMIQNL